MRLSSDDVNIFYKLNPSLLFYVNKQMGIIKGISTVDEIMEIPIEEKLKIRNALYENKGVFDSFVKDNIFDFSPEELNIVLSWKNFVSGTFYLFRYLNDYTIFLNTEEPPKAYAVLAIQSTFDEMFGGNAPIMIQTVLLPFRDKIIYDGFTMPYNIIFGGNIRRSLDDSYREANARFGIITQLPFSGKEKDSAERLKAYLKTKRSRELHQEEIEALINKDRKLRIIYEQEMGKIHAQAYRKRLRDNGLSNLWFGILDGVIVASGSTKGKLEANLKDILTKDKMDLVYVFQLK